MSVGDIKQPWEILLLTQGSPQEFRPLVPEVLDTDALTALSRNYERRILELEKQVAELRALLVEKK